MSVHITWDNEDQTVLRYDFQGDWTWDEFRAATEEAFAMTRSVDHIVDSISYFHPGASMPPNALFQFRRAMNYAPENRGKTAIVGGSILVTSLVGVFSRVYKQLGEKLILANTLDEARVRLAEQRETSPA